MFSTFFILFRSLCSDFLLLVSAKITKQEQPDREGNIRDSGCFFYLYGSCGSYVDLRLHLRFGDPSVAFDKNPGRAVPLTRL